MTHNNFLQLESDFRSSYNTYAEGLDTKDWGKVRSCFADQICVDYGPIIDPTGNPDKLRSADDWVAQLKFNIGGFDFTRHTISNHRVITDNDSFICKAYLIADHVMFRDPSMPLVGDEDIATVVGEYTNEYRMEAGSWKIVRSRLAIHWSQGNIELFGRAIERSANL